MSYYPDGALARNFPSDRYEAEIDQIIADSQSKAGDMHDKLDRLLVDARDQLQSVSDALPGVDNDELSDTTMWWRSLVEQLELAVPEAARLTGRRVAA